MSFTILLFVLKFDGLRTIVDKTVIWMLIKYLTKLNYIIICTCSCGMGSHTSSTSKSTFPPQSLTHEIYQVNYL